MCRGGLCATYSHNLLCRTGTDADTRAKQTWIPSPVELPLQQGLAEYIPSFSSSGQVCEHELCSSWMLCCSHIPKPRWKQWRQFRPAVHIRFKYIKIKFVLESEKYIFFDPSDGRFAIGLCKAPLISITKQMKASLTILFQWLFCSLHLPIVLYSTGLPPLLFGVWLRAFSSCMTSSARQGTAVCIFLQVPKSQSAWVSSLAEDVMSSTDLWSHVLRLNNSVCDFTT